MTATLALLGLFAGTLGSSLLVHRGRRLLGRSAFEAALGLTAALITLVDTLGARALIADQPMLISTAALLPAWLSLSIVAWLGRAREEVSSFVLPYVALLLVWAFALVLFDLVAGAPWGATLSLAEGAHGAAARVGVVACAAGSGLAITLWAFVTLQRSAARMPLAARAVITSTLGCLTATGVEWLVGGPTGDVTALALLVRMSLGALGGGIVGAYLSLERRRLNRPVGREADEEAPDQALKRLTSGVDWTAVGERRDPYAVLFWESADATIVADANRGRILAANLKAQELTDRTLEQLLPMTVSELFGADVPPTGAPRQLELWRNGRDTLPVSAQATPVSLPDHPVRLLTFRDITRELQIHQRQIHSERLEVVGQIAGGVAHDFNNLLQGILGYANLLRPDSAPELLEKGLTTINRYARRGAELTGSLMRLSRDREEVRGACDPRAAMHNVSYVIRQSIARGHTVQLRTCEEELFVPIPATRLEELILELAINARDAMPSGGVLRLSVAAMDIDAMDVEQGVALTPGPYVEIAVQDTGSGMSPDITRVAFEPYTTSKDGSGMGLAVVWSVVRSVGGWVSIDSVEERGTAVRMLFPRTFQVVLDDEPAEHSILPLAVVPRRILVVDDEEDLRDMIEIILGAQGYEVIQAVSGAAALEKLETDLSFDTILLDMVMPGLDGAGVLRELNRRDCTIPIVLATGYAPDELDIECQHLVTRTLRKPFLAKDLIRTLEECWAPAYSD